MGRSLNRLNSVSEGNLDQAYKDAVNIVKHSFLREKKTIRSIQELDPAASMLQENLKIAELNLLAHKTNYLQYVEAQYTSICDRLDHRTQEIMLTAEERAADNVVYARNPELKGPLGSSYLKKQLGPETDLSALQLMQRGSLIGYEVLSFVDGQNSVLDIRNAVSAEYMPVPLEEVKNFLALLDEAGVIKQTGNN